jgi:putative SOS response-associated peptidase YedK
MRWGLIPHWAKEAKIGNRMINARSESVAEKSSFKTPLKRSRCLVLADGFYEWRKTESGKQPYHIHLTENRVFTFAGLWDRWAKGPEGVVESFTILTTSANDKVSELHDRMPVILDGEARHIWLDRSVEDPAVLVPLLRPFANDEIEFHPVTKDVNTVKSNGPDLVRQIEL